MSKASEIHAKDNRLEISRGIKTGKSGIDRTYEDEKYRGVIHGCAVMTKMTVQDVRGWEIDDTTLGQIVNAGNVHKMGLKSRFGHPNMSSEALGTFIGRLKNFSQDGDIARADLFISRTAYETPQGDLASYVLDLAEKDPAAFGTSVVLGDWDLEKRLELDGTAKKDGEGNELPALLRVKTLMACDVVDDPAANNSLFGKFFNSSVELSAKASEFLDKLLNNSDALETVIKFLERYRLNRVEIDENQIQKQTKEEGMELKDLTLEVLSKERPDLVTAIRTEERARGLAIVKAGNSEFKGMGMESLVEESIDKGLTVDASLASMRGKRLADLQSQSKVPGADGAEPGKQDHLSKAKAYQKDHNCSITVALTATAEKRLKK